MRERRNGGVVREGWFVLFEERRDRRTRGGGRRVERVERWVMDGLWALGRYVVFFSLVVSNRPSPILRLGVLSQSSARVVKSSRRGKGGMGLCVRVVFVLCNRSAGAEGRWRREVGLVREGLSLYCRVDESKLAERCGAVRAIGAKQVAFPTPARWGCSGSGLWSFDPFCIRSVGRYP